MSRILALAFLFVVTASCTKQNVATTAMPHFDLEMTSVEMQSFFDKQIDAKLVDEDVQKRLDTPIRVGKRSLEWLNHINSHRNEKISFSNPNTMRGIPMDKPSEYNEAIALQKYNDVVAMMPDSVKKILVDGEAFTSDPGIPLEQYVEIGEKLDKAYQTAIRWLMMQPYLDGLAMRRYMDIRGYYFIQNYPNRDQALTDVTSLPTEEQAKITEWLAGVCMNAGASSNCADEAKSAIRNKTAKDFFNTNKAASKRIWDSLHNIRSTYSGVEWTLENSKIARVPFQSQKTTDMTRFLKKNIEDEWKWDGWMLKVYFTSTNPSAIEVIWEPGITPHVPGLGSNQIYMDANAPLTEWDVQWTIRHEFGHNLGFPDCYIEFYDSDRGVIINYQIDTSDLMCSRAGKLKERHFNEMKRAYLR